MDTYVLEENEPWITCTTAAGSTYHGVCATRTSDGNLALYRSIHDIMLIDATDVCRSDDDRRSECAVRVLTVLYTQTLFRTQSELEKVFRLSMTMLACNPGLRIDETVSRVFRTMKEFEQRWGHTAVLSERLTIP